VYQHSSPLQAAFDMTDEARLDRQRQHAAIIARERQLLDRRRELDRMRRMHEQFQAAHTAAAHAAIAAADATYQQHRAVAALPQQHHATNMLLAALVQSRSARPVHRYEAIMQAVRGSRAMAPDGMSYDQLLQAFGNGTENMGASDGDLQQLPISTVVDPDKDLPENLRTCNICLEDFAAGDERRTLPCLHGYHKECSDKWLKTNASCPVCKHSIRE
jgi:hypothetical protein